MDIPKIKIIVDYRELRSNVARKLFDRGAEIDSQSLPVGDFILSEDVCVELKKVDDFVNSLVDGRLFVQAKQIRRNFKKPLYIIEGKLASIFEVRNVHPKAIRAALVSLLLDYQIPFLFAHSEEETAELLHTIAEREQFERNKEVALRGNKKAFSFAEQQQFFIEGIPSIGPSLAKNLLKHFGSCNAVLNASLEDLQQVEKVGEKKAQLIKDIVDRSYEFDV